MNNKECMEFSNLYCALSEDEKRKFSEVVNKLLKINFLLKINSEELYMFIINNKEVISLYYGFMNFDFFVREDKELAYIKTNNDKLINRINKNETLCLLTLRLLYQKKLDEVSLADEVEITVKELQDELFAVGFNDMTNERVRKTLLIDMLRTFKQHNIVYYRDDISLDNTVIIIYPSIEVAMDFKQMDEVLRRRDLLTGGEEIYD